MKLRFWFNQYQTNFKRLMRWIHIGLHPFRYTTKSDAEPQPRGACICAVRRSIASATSRHCFSHARGKR